MDLVYHHQESKKVTSLERQFPQTIYLVTDLYLKYIKNYYNSVTKRQTANLKMGKGSE
jgi:hypothetical protein